MNFSMILPHFVTRFADSLHLNYISLIYLRLNSGENEEEVERVAKRHLALDELSPIEIDCTPVPLSVGGVSAGLMSVHGNSMGSSQGQYLGFSQAAQSSYSYSHTSNHHVRHSHSSHGTASHSISSTSHSHQQHHHQNHPHSHAYQHVASQGPSHSDRSCTSWLASMRAFFLPMLKENSKGRTSFIAAAQAAAAQAAVSQAAEEEAKVIAASSVVNTTTTVQKPGKKKGPKKDQSNEEQHGHGRRHGRQVSLFFTQ